MAIKVLVVDDAVFVRETLKRMIQTLPYEEISFVEAGDGNEAFEIYKQAKPDIVTMDITMPECDGLESLKLIREFDPKAKVVMVSAMGQQMMVIEAIQNGAADFIVKPFKEEAVRAKLMEVLDK